MESKQSNLERAATKLLNEYNKFDQLRELGNRKNYPNKLRKLEERLTEDISFWERKGPSARLDDLTKDMKFVQLQLEQTVYDKERIDLLTNKYSIGYGENRSQ